jgi:hypothetical protein
MANQNPKGKSNYWYNGVATTLIKPRVKINIGQQSYWYNGQPQGYLITIRDTVLIVPRAYAVLIGF